MEIREFNQVGSLHEAKLEAMVWSVDSINSHHYNKVIFAIDDCTLNNIILIPRAKPNFKGQSTMIMNRLARMEWWRVTKGDRSTNRGAFFIAQSVIKGRHHRSYVAAGSPSWLFKFFQSERVVLLGCLNSFRVRRFYPLCSVRLFSTVALVFGCNFLVYGV